MKTIAYVEENEDNRLLVRAILQDHYRIVEYASGHQAIEELPHVMPDLVLLDISLPEMDGTEILRRIRRDPQIAGLPVIALTAHAMSGDREKFLSVGFDEYVSKPIVDEEILLEAIRNLLR